MMEKSIVEFVSSFPFGLTLDRLQRRILQAGMTIFARVDHADAASKLGIQMPPTVVLLYGDPRGGTPIMLAAPQAALDLPLRVLVRQDEIGQVLIAFHPVESALRLAGVPAELAGRLAPGQRMLIDAIQI